jgi:hypothetical protein
VDLVFLFGSRRFSQLSVSSFAQPISFHSNGYRHTVVNELPLRSRIPNENSDEHGLGQEDGLATSRRDTALIAAICAAPAKGSPRKWPENCRTPGYSRAAVPRTGSHRSCSVFRECCRVLGGEFDFYRLAGGCTDCNPPDLREIETKTFPRCQFPRFCFFKIFDMHAEWCSITRVNSSWLLFPQSSRESAKLSSRC